MRYQRRRKTGSTASLVDCLEIRALLASDFGDAPSPYPVTLAGDGAQHVVGVGSPRFGATIDTEADGQPSDLANGDGADEDGISLPSVFYAGRIGSVTFDVRNAVQAPRIDGWIDFNADGDWTDVGEQVFDSISVAQADLTPRTINVPDTAAIGYTFARFRISTAGDLSPTGEALDGEVQDHRVFIGFPWPDVTSPTQNSDVNVTGTNRVTMTWGSVTGAVNYDVWINYGTQNQWHRATVSGTTYTPDVNFPVGQYHMYIRSFGSNGLTSAWSPVRDFQVVAKTTINPMVRDQNTFRPTISWAAIPGNPQYKVWISDLVNNRQVLLAESLTSTSFTPSTDLPRGSYRVWVSMQTPELWSTPVNFRIAVSPEPTEGINPTFNRRQTFGWNPLSVSPVSYDFQLRNRNTGAVVINSTNMEMNFYTPLSDLADGPYRWWVRAKLPGNIYTLWSAPTDIFVGGRTDVLAPTGSMSDTTPTFSWRPVTGAARYELWVVRNNTTVVINKTDNTTTSYTPTTSLATGNYRVWVRAVSTENQFAPWSLPVSFVIASNNELPQQQLRQFLEEEESMLLTWLPTVGHRSQKPELKHPADSSQYEGNANEMNGMVALTSTNEASALSTVPHFKDTTASTEPIHCLESLDTLFALLITH